METIFIDDVFKLLQCDENGLSHDEATRRLDLFGPNKLQVEEQNAFLQVWHICLHRPCYVSSLLILVLEFYVEPPIMGDGGCRSCGHRPFQRSAQASGLARFRRYRSTSVYQLVNWFLRRAERR